MNKMMGQVAYEAYYAAIGGHATDKHWGMISPDEQRAWCAVAERVAIVIASANKPQMPMSAGPDQPAFTGRVL